jgi:hypothetical protein
MILFLYACHFPVAPAAEKTGEPMATAEKAQPAPLAETTSGILAGVCEASALIWVEGHWLVGDNEVNDRLFVYDAQFQATGTVPVVPPVEDIEALATDGSRVFVVGSAGRKKSGKPAPERRRVVELGKGEVPIPWENCPECGLDLPPEDGGINIEGAAWWKGGLWLGFRSPVVGGKTRLWRPDGGELLQEDWGGAGVRDLSVRGGELLLLLGPSVKEERPFQLRSLSGTPGPSLPEGAEGLGVSPDGSLWVVTDGGWSQDMAGCKKPSRWEKVPG